MTELEGSRHGDSASLDTIGNEGADADSDGKDRRVDSVGSIAGFVSSAAATVAAIPANPFAVSSTGGPATILHSMPTSTSTHHAHDAPLIMQAESMCTEDDEITVDTGTESQPVTADSCRNDTGVHVEVAGEGDRCNFSVQEGVVGRPNFESPFSHHLHPPFAQGKLATVDGSEAVLLDSVALRPWDIINSGSTASSSDSSIYVARASPLASSHGVTLMSSSFAISSPRPAEKHDLQQRRQSEPQPQPQRQPRLQPQPQPHLAQHRLQQSMNMGTQASAHGSEDYEAAANRPGSSTRKRRLVRLDDGSLVVLPTNIYRQAGGLKLDLSLGGIRINGERCTMKNRAFNFGVLHGFSRENILALRAFRNIIVPSDRSTATSIHVLTAAEALRRYDEEHLPPPAGSETASYVGVGGWIPDSQEVHITVVGSKTEMCVRASELRAVNRPFECRKVLEALKADPEVLAGHVELASEISVAQDDDDGGSGGLSVGLSVVGEKAGSLGSVVGTGVARLSIPRVSPSSEGSGEVVVSVSPSPSTFAETVGSAGESRELLLESPAMSSGNVEGFAPRRRRRKKKAVLTEDGEVFDLPTYVQNVETKQNRSTLRLKMPLSGFLVNGEEASVADLVVACGLEVTRKNLLALRGARDIVLQHFAGPPEIRRLVAAEVFHVWAKRRLSSAVSSAPWATPPSVAASSPMVSGSAPGVTTSSELKSAGRGLATTSGIGTPAKPASASSTAGLDAGGGAALASSTSVSTPTMFPLLSYEGSTLTDDVKSLQMAFDIAAETSAGAAGTSPGVTMGVSLGTAPQASTETTSTLAASTAHGVVTSIVSHSAMTVGEQPCLSELGVAERGVGASPSPETPSVAGPLQPPSASTRGLSCCPSGPASSSNPLELRDDSVMAIAGPPSLSGAARAEVRMTVSELHDARAQRSAVFRQLVNTMLNDPIVQGGELDTATHQQPMALTMMTATMTTMTTNALTPQSSSSSSALVPKDSVQECDVGATSHLPPLLSATPNAEGHALAIGYSGVVAAAHASTNGGALESRPASPPTPTATVDSTAAVKPDLETQDNKAKGLVGIAAEGDTDSCIAASKRETDDVVGDPESTGVGKLNWGAAIEAAGISGGKDDRMKSSMTPEAAAASKRRRQLWMQEISANERRYVRRKELARKEFEVRQQQLLSWMVDEEAGRHDDLDGYAGPPPDEAPADSGCPNAVRCSDGT